MAGAPNNALARLAQRMPSREVLREHFEAAVLRQSKTRGAGTFEDLRNVTRGGGRMLIIETFFNEDVIERTAELAPTMQLAAAFELDKDAKTRIITLLLPRLLLSSHGAWPQERRAWCLQMMRDSNMELKDTDQTFSTAQNRLRDDYQVR